MMVHAAQHDDTNAVFALQLIKRGARLPTYLGLAFLQGLEADDDGTLILFAGETEHGAPDLEHLISADLFILEIQYRIEVEDVVLRKDIALFRECGLDSLG